MASADSARPRVLGLTGPIGCGKSAAGDILLELGALNRIDADQTVHHLLAAGSPVATEVIDQFGKTVEAAGGAVDRQHLAAIVFSDPGALATLEAILHPHVHAAIRKDLDRYAGQRGVVVVEAVKLLQSTLLDEADAIWLIRCDSEQQMGRLTGTRGMDAAQARARVSAQPSFDHPRVGTIIDNSTTRDDLHREIAMNWHNLLVEWGLQAF